MKSSEGRPLLLFLLAGLAVRLLLAPFLGHPFDLRVFMAVGWAVAHGRTPYGQYFLHSIFADIPHPHLYGAFPGIGYPPPWGLICGLMYRISSLFGPNIYMHSLALKVPIILGDLATALVIYRILQKNVAEEIAWKAYRLYLFCPFLLLVGVVWGMFDVLAFLFSLLSAYYLLEHSDLSSACLGIASVFKLFPAVLAPLYSIFVYKSTGSSKRALEYFFGVVTVGAFLTLLPMAVFNWPLSNLYHALAYHVESPGPGGEYNIGSGFSYGCAGPFNVLNVIRLFHPSVEIPFLLAFVWVFACLILYWYGIRKVRKVGLRSVFSWSFLAMLVFFSTRVWVSDQNLLLLLSFFLLTVVLRSGSWRRIHSLWTVLLIFTLVHVPLIAFLWMPYPWTLNAASAFCDGPLGWVRWLLMSVLTFTWLGICWHYAVKRVTWSE